MAKIAWLGTGMMGSGFVQALLRRGDDVVVWNRTGGKAERLREHGAQVAATAREAIHGVDRIHSILSDDAAVDALLADLHGHIATGTPFIDHTTVAPLPTAARFARAEKQGIEFLHAPVFMSPRMTAESKGIMLVAGPQARFERTRDELAKMCSDLWYLGERPDKAAAFKLFGNSMLFFIVAGLTDMFTLAKSVGISSTEAHELFEHFKPGGAIDARGASMARGDFTTAFELRMARKDARLMLETAQAGGTTLGVLPSIVEMFDAAIARGHGAHDFSVIAKDAVTS
jgi:3-hydroxyisobutyrate dehydrogenase